MFIFVGGCALVEVLGAIMNRNVVGTRFVALIGVSLLLVLMATIVRAIYASGGGVALVLEAIHGATDVIATALVIGAVAVSRSRLAARFPYGLYKLEDMVSLGIAVALAYVAIELGLKGLSKDVPRVEALSSYAQLVSIPLVLGSGYAKLLASKEVSSPAIRSDAIHTFGDAVEGLGVGLGLLLSSAYGSALAYRLAVLIAVIGVSYAAYEAGRDGVLALLDLPVDREAIKVVEEVAKEVAKGFELASAKCRWAGPALFVELVLEAPPLAVVEDLHALSRELEREIARRLGYVVRVTTMFVPRKRSSIRICIPCESPSLDALVSEHFGRAKYFAIITVVGNEVKSVEFVEREKLSGARERLVGASVAEELSRMGVSDVVVYRMGEIAYALLLRHRIVVWRVDEKLPVSRIVELLLEGKLERMVSPTCEEPWARRA